MLVILVFLLFFLCFSFRLESRLVKGVQILSFTVLGILLNVKICISPYSRCSLFSSVGGFEVRIVTLSIWVRGLMLLVRLKYRIGRQNPGIFVFWVLVLLLVMIGFFLTDSFLVLYVCFEVSLLPTLVLILKWGYQPERLQARFYFIIYTICASLPLLFRIVKIKNHFFSFSIDFGGALIVGVKGFNFGLAYWALVIAFLVKVPMWGVHLWLPKAHVEAPVSGSIVLAGVLLKLGGYGLVKMSGFIYKISSRACCLVYAINLWGAFIIRFICLSCVDIKTLIAYSSVVHINLIVLGVLSDRLMGVVGRMLIIISHGVRSPGMFAIANMNYEKVQSRNLLLQKGFCLGQPRLMFGWFVLLSANIAAPPSLNLFREILIIIRVLKVGFFLGLVVGFVTFLRAGYNLYLYSSQQGRILVFGVPSGSECSVNLLVYLVHCFVVYALVLKVVCIC